MVSWIGMADDAQRTTHRRKATGAAPVWGKAGADWEYGGSPAEREDRSLRAAYGKVVRSAYLLRVRLPERVAAGNHGEAAEILGRIEGCLADPERWTVTEKKRLRGMREAWARRAGGRDVVFNTIGWQHRPRYQARGAWQDKQEALTLARTIGELEKIWRTDTARGK